MKKILFLLLAICFILPECAEAKAVKLGRGKSNGAGSGAAVLNIGAETTVPTCSDGEFYHSAAYGCQACGKKYGLCSTCTATACTGCPDGYSLQNGVCTSICSDGEFYHSAAYGCQACGKKYGLCSTCTATACTGCPDGYSLQNGVCTSVCSSGEFYHSAAYGCQACAKKYGICAECTASDCTACPTGYILNGSIKDCPNTTDYTYETMGYGGCGQCVKKLCKSGYSYNTMYQGCIKDTIDCKVGCDPKGCGIGSTLAPSKGFYVKEDGTCPSCSGAITGCDLCSIDKLGATPVCTQCQSGYTLKNGKCEETPCKATGYSSNSYKNLGTSKPACTTLSEWYVKEFGKSGTKTCYACVCDGSTFGGGGCCPKGKVTCGGTEGPCVQCCNDNGCASGETCSNGSCKTCSCPTGYSPKNGMCKNNSGSDYRKCNSSL